MWPTISLDAVNREAARLLSAGGKTDTSSVSALEKDLVTKGAEVAQAITSIEGQLAVRCGDLQWRSSAKRALSGYRAQQSNLKAHLKTCRGLLHFMTTQIKQVAKSEAKQWHRSLKAKNSELKTIQAKNEIDQKTRFLENLKKVMRDKLGAQTTIELFREAGALTNPVE